MTSSCSVAREFAGNWRWLGEAWEKWCKLATALSDLNSNTRIVFYFSTGFSNLWSVMFWFAVAHHSLLPFSPSVLSFTLASCNYHAYGGYILVFGVVPGVDLCTFHTWFLWRNNLSLGTLRIPVIKSFFHLLGIPFFFGRRLSLFLSGTCVRCPHVDNHIREWDN